MKVILDGCRMTDKETAHQYLKEQLNFPDYYGCNLDALYDCLTETAEKTEVCLSSTEAMRESLSDYADALIETIRDAVAENPNLQLTEVK